MRIDQGTSPDLSPDPSPDRPETARLGAGLVAEAALALLMAGTGWAVASLVSPWLVPPYLILMALLLSPSGRRPQGEPGSEASEASESSRSAQPFGTSDASDPASDGPDSPEGADDESEQAAASKPARARRGKGKVRKTKPPPEPTEATWIQVAPGKFVRAEAADDPMGLAGPHPPVETPAEPATAPRRLESGEDEAADPLEDPADDQASPRAWSEAEPSISTDEPDLSAGPIEDARPAFDLVEGPEGDPTGAFDSAPSPQPEEEGELADCLAVFEGPSAADGNAPQSEECPGNHDASPPETFTLDEAEGLAEVGPEEDDEPGATLEEADPTETPVDETDLDDAGPLEPAPSESSPSGDADRSARETFPDPSDGPSCWPWGLAPRAWTRVGQLPPRSTGRTPPRRPHRSPEPARRPRDPRRLGRRGLARPRQVNRSFPPRSPPCRPCRPGRGQLRFKGVRNASIFLLI